MLLNAIQDYGIFKRNKIPLEIELLVCLLYLSIWTIFLSGLSYRSILQTGIIRACYS